MISNGIVKSNFYVKHELEIGNMTLVMGIMSYIGINIQNNIIEQVAVNQSINGQFFTAFAFMYLVKIITRFVNMKYLMRTVTHKKRVWIAALIIFVSNMILAFSFIPFLVKTDSRLQYYLNLISFLLVAVAAALADATIIGYFRCFHKDLVEPWGTGTSIA